MNIYLLTRVSSRRFVTKFDPFYSLIIYLLTRVSSIRFVTKFDPFYSLIVHSCKLPFIKR